MVIARRRAADRARLRDPAAWGIEASQLALPVNSDVEAALGPAKKILRARRQDVFDLLHGRGRLSRAALEAARRLQADAALLHRTVSGGRELGPRVDISRRPEGMSDARRAAGERIAAALRLAGASSAALLSALVEGESVLGRADDWRAVVRRITGESLADAQGAVLRAACENLAGAYAALDRERARASAR